MMVTLTFAAVLLLAIGVSLVDWRRGWLLALLCGVLQDPARKLTPGTPVVMTLSVAIVYFAILFSAQKTLQRYAAELTRRFGRIYLLFIVLVLFLVLAAINGLFTYGVALWKVPMLSFFIYLLPIPAVVLGYTYLRREEDLYSLFGFYGVITAIALIGTPLEYFKVSWRALGMVALPEGYIRHLPGVQIRILSGFYRAPDIMGWHASMLTIIGIAMAVRAGNLRKAWPWMLAASWGFLNCIISGRRKAVYMVAVFAIMFLWRYFRRLTFAQVISFAFLGVLLAGVVHNIASDAEAGVYTKGTVTSREEVFQRLEGGVFETIEQFGFMGAGLGTATQGVRHFLGSDVNIGWQEGGLGKLAIELGVPGLLVAMLFAFVLMRLLLQITRHPDVPGSSQFIRVTLFAIVAANVVNFMVSAQAYSDAMLTLLSAFYLGCLLATTVLDERLVELETPQVRPRSGLTAPATA